MTVRRAIEVKDAAALLRLDAAEVPDAIQVGADLQRSQTGKDVGLHLRMQDHLVEVMTRLRLHEVADVKGRFLFIAIPPAAARVAVRFQGRFVWAWGWGGVWVQACGSAACVVAMPQSAASMRVVSLPCTIWRA